MAKKGKTGPLVLTITALVGVVFYFESRCPTELQDISLGTFAGREMAESASIQALAHASRKCTNTKNYQVWFNLKQSDQLGGGGVIIYDRLREKLGFAFEPESGYVIYWTNVDDATIQAISATNGVLESFGKPAWSSSR